MRPWKLTIKGQTTYHPSILDALSAIRKELPLHANDIVLTCDDMPHFNGDSDTLIGLAKN